MWMNGELMSADEVRVSPFDLGLTVGLGVFETMCAYRGRVFAYDRHHSRLMESAGILGLATPSQEVIKKAMTWVIAANDLASGRARVRVSVTGGVNPLHGGGAEGSVIITAVHQAEPAGMAKLVVGQHGCDESSTMAGIKSASYACHVMAYRQAIEAGADEALVLNSRGIVAEGAMSNLFVVKEGKVKTPSLSSGCLAGVTRAWVIELCEKEGIPCHESVLGEADVREADEIFITSSTREVQPARMLNDDREAAGPVTAQLAAAYKTLVKQQLGI